MKTLMKLANNLNKSCAFKGMIFFEGNVARATNIDLHAVIDGGAWQFGCATVVDSVQIKMALALNSKNPVWAGDTLNGVKLVSAYPANDFPALPAYDGTKVDCANLAAHVARTLPAAADNNIRYWLRYWLNGLCFDHSERAIIGCDGHRAHMVTDAYTSGLTGQAIVPRSAFDITGARNVLNIGFTDKYFRLGYCGGYIIGKLVDGTYPDYKRVFPADSERPNKVKFNGAQIAAAKSIVAIVKAKKSKFGAVAIGFDGSLEAYDIRVPCFDGFSIVPRTGKDGALQVDTVYGVNAAYLYDAMDCAKHGTIGVGQAIDGLLITEGDYRAVVMPRSL